MPTTMDGMAADLAAAVREGRVRPRDAVADSLARIARLDGEVGAFRTVRGEAALAEAEALEARPDLSALPLAGVPVAVKDNLPVRGVAGRNGSAATPDVPAPADHPVVERLRAAGAVVVGTTQVPELCLFGTCDSVYGITRSPWDPSRTAGGSSGGSAAAVAAGMVPVAVGNDSMGSLRIPAAQCGVIALKPGPGLVPGEISGSSGWYGMAENGPLATGAEDLALLFSVLAGREPRDRGPADPGSLRLAFSTRSPVPGVAVTRPYADAVRTSAALLAGDGYRAAPADPPYPRWLGGAAFVRWAAGASAAADGLDRRLLTPRTRRQAALGRVVSRTPLPGADYRGRLARRLSPFFRHHDVLMTPALARPGPAATAWHRRGWLSNILVNARFCPFTTVWNLVGWPALVLPAGRQSDGFPLAVQLVARPGGEPLLLALAARLEALQPWPRTAPAGGDLAV